jgi:hypothetical protein
MTEATMAVTKSFRELVQGRVARGAVLWAILGIERIRIRRVLRLIDGKAVITGT